VQEIPLSRKQRAIRRNGFRRICRHPSVLQKPLGDDDFPYVD
jgi:hypothetical protein